MTMLLACTFSDSGTTMLEDSIQCKGAHKRKTVTMLRMEYFVNEKRLNNF